MPYLLRVPEQSTFGRGKYLNKYGNTDPLIFVRTVTAAPVSALWRPGVRVKDQEPGRILRGVLIATFNQDGGIPDDKLGAHAAIYLAHDDQLIWVLDQWPAQGQVRQRAIFFKVKPDTLRRNDGNWFHVVE